MSTDMDRLRRLGQIAYLVVRLACGDTDRDDALGCPACEAVSTGGVAPAAAPLSA